MSDDRIKSAFEIAMEKVHAIGEPTEAEVREYRVKEFRPYGEVIAENYLARKIKESALSARLGEYTGELPSNSNAPEKAFPILPAVLTKATTDTLAPSTGQTGYFQVAGSTNTLATGKTRPD